MITTAISLLILATQDKPVDIPKAELAESAPCVICTANGEGHGEEKPAAGVMFKGKAYYFCNTKEVDTFKADPEAFLPPVLPRAMPKFDLADTTGKAWNAAAMKEKVVLVDFWATWCRPCQDMKPIIERTHANFANKNFEVLSVSIDEKEETLKGFLKKNKFSNPVLFDSKQTWAEWNVRVIPAFFVVKDGQIVEQWNGLKSEKEVHGIIEPHLAKD